MAYVMLNDGRKLWYTEEGSGKPVVLIHGWKASANVYEDTSRRLAEAGYRAIRYDHVGHMRSDLPDFEPDLKTLADDLHEVLTQLKLEKPILVGWSMGGATILEYIRRYGCAHLERIVIVDMSPCVLNDETWTFTSRNRLFHREEAEANVALMRKDFREFLRWYYKRGIPGFVEKTAQEQDAVIEERMKGHDPKVLTPLMEALYYRDHRDVLPKITCPTGIFYADLLPVCSAEVGEYYRREIPAATRIVKFEGCSHSLIVEDPERFARELLDFFVM